MLDAFLTDVNRIANALEDIAQTNRDILKMGVHSESGEAYTDLSQTSAPEPTPGPTSTDSDVDSASSESGAYIPEGTPDVHTTSDDPDPMPEWDPRNEDTQSRYAGKKPEKLDWMLRAYGMTEIPSRWNGKQKHQRILDFAKAAAEDQQRGVTPTQTPETFAPAQEPESATPPPPEPPVAPSAPTPETADEPPMVDLDASREALKGMMQSGQAEQAFTIMRKHGCPNGPSGNPVLTIEGAPAITQEQATAITNECNMLLGSGIG